MAVIAPCTISLVPAIQSRESAEPDCVTIACDRGNQCATQTVRIFQQWSVVTKAICTTGEHVHTSTDTIADPNNARVILIDREYEVETKAVRISWIVGVVREGSI